jgi:predicted nucleic acid-binding protein
MITAYPDTSFLCAIYRQQENSKEAAAIFEALEEPLSVSCLLLCEFRQSTRFQIFRNTQNPANGFPKAVGLKALVDLQSDLTTGAIVVIPVDWANVHHIAERISAQYTMTKGHRTMDILHVATALHTGAGKFISFDENQRKLAMAEGLKLAQATQKI